MATGDPRIQQMCIDMMRTFEGRMRHHREQMEAKCEDAIAKARQLADSVSETTAALRPFAKEQPNG